MLRAVRERLDPPWPWLAGAAALLFVAYCHGDYGATWDEDIQDRYGAMTLDYFRSGGSHREYEQFEDVRYYAPTVELALAVARGSDASQRFDRRRLWLGVLALLSIPALALFVRDVRRAEFGIFAVTALWMMPRFIGHIHNNSKDIPFAVAMTFYFAALAYAARAPRVGPRQALALGLGLGGALCVRAGILPVALVYAAGAFLWARLSGVRPRVASGAAPWWRSATWLLGAFCLAWACMVLPWPYAHADPLRRPLQASLQALSFPRVYVVLFDGQELPSNQLPARYLIQYLTITTPPGAWLLAAIGLLADLRARRVMPRSEAFVSGLAWWWFALPLAVFVLLRPNTYDGIRHFLFILPALAVLVARGALALLDAVRATRLRALGLPLALGLVCSPLPALVALHPYQSSYFNAFAGGLPGVQGRYEMDYWASCLRESMLQVNARAQGSTEVLLGVRSLYPKAAAEYYAAPGVHVVAMGEASEAVRTTGVGFDYYVAPMRRHMAEEFLSAPIVDAVVRDGVPFCIVRDLRDHGGAAAGAGGGT